MSAHMHAVLPGSMVSDNEHFRPVSGLKTDVVTSCILCVRKGKDISSPELVMNCVTSFRELGDAS